MNQLKPSEPFNEVPNGQHDKSLKWERKMYMCGCTVLYNTRYVCSKRDHKEIVTFVRHSKINQIREKNREHLKEHTKSGEDQLYFDVMKIKIMIFLIIKFDCLLVLRIKIKLFWFLFIFMCFSGHTRLIISASGSQSSTIVWHQEAHVIKR